MIHRIKEELDIGETKYVLSTQEFADGTKEEGYRYLTEFSFEILPSWRYLTSGVEIEKEIVMAQGSNQIAVNYHMKNRGQEEAVLCVTPFFQFEPKGEDLKEDKIFSRQDQKITDGKYNLFFETNGETEEFQEKKETYFYRYDECDGRRENGTASAVYQIKKRVKPGEETDLTVIYSLESRIDMDAKKLFDKMKEEQIHHHEKLIKTSGLKNKLAQTLVCGADKFLSKRESTDGLTILAGFPFFEDWGRDTMIALPGICISTGRFESAKSILRTFACYEKDGLMPNLFPEGENEPLYNTVDCLKLYDVVRIDHFRGFDEYYSIPYGNETAVDGTWMPGPGMDLFHTIEERLGKLNIIAEDLGFLTESVLQMLSDSGFPGMKVVQFAFDPNGGSTYLPHNYPENSVVYTGTHDNDTTRGWYHSTDKATRDFAKEYMNAQRLDEDDLAWDFIRLAMSSMANLCVTPMQDLLNLDGKARINVPSTLGGNWTWRMEKGQFDEKAVERLKRMTWLYERLPEKENKVV